MTSVERKRLADRAHRIMNEIAQIARDVEHWNRLHPDEEPIDPDPDGTLKRAYHVLTRFLKMGTTGRDDE